METDSHANQMNILKEQNEQIKKFKGKMNKRLNEHCMQLYIIWEQRVARHDNTNGPFGLRWREGE